MDKGKVLKDDEEVVITGKELAKHRDICRKEGAIEVLKRLVKEEGLKMSGNEMIYFNKDEFNALKEALLALEKQENYVIDFIRLESLPRSKKEQFRVFFKDGTEQVFEKERVGEQK